MSLQKSQRSVVVLAGWLGCQAKALQKYKALYERLLGVDQVTVHSRCVHPKWIVQTCMDESKNMDDLAQQLVQDVSRSMMITPEGCNPLQKPEGRLYFHAFSNAGCMLWERFRNHLVSKSGSNDILHRISGVIFDSCPIVDLSLIRQALKQCTWKERAEVVRECGGLDYLEPKNLRAYAERFEATLREDSLPIPQLYLYSRNDPLTPFEFIRSIVNHRRKKLPTLYIDDFYWDESIHCAHLLRHPEAYERVVGKFLREVGLEQVPQSRL